MKKTRVIFLPEAEEVYHYLNRNAQTSKTEKTILNAVNKKIKLIKENKHYGNPIAKKLIPEEYKKKIRCKKHFSSRTTKLLENAIYTHPWRFRN